MVCICLSILFSPLSSRAEGARDCVILLHGMGRSYHSMDELEQALLGDDYQVVNVDYPSTDYPVETLSEKYIPAAINTCRSGGAEAINFVTHSLGGILLRHYLQQQLIPELSKIVMLSPPNHGSEVADELVGWLPYRWIMGPPGQQLGTGEESLPNSLKPISGHIGVIAGNVSLDPWFSVILPGEDDGKVTIKSARLGEMVDFWIVDSGHAFIMKNDKVIAQVLYFLNTGHFDHTI